MRRPIRTPRPATASGDPFQSIDSLSLASPAGSADAAAVRSWPNKTPRRFGSCGRSNAEVDKPLDAVHTGNVCRPQLVGNIPLDALLAGGRVQVGHVNRNRRVQRRGIDALIEQARGDERGDANADAQCDEQGQRPAPANVAERQRSEEGEHAMGVTRPRPVGRCVRGSVLPMRPARLRCGRSDRRTPRPCDRGSP